MASYDLNTYMSDLNRVLGMSSVNVPSISSYSTYKPPVASPYTYNLFQSSGQPSGGQSILPAVSGAGQPINTQIPPPVTTPKPTVPAVAPTTSAYGTGILKVGSTGDSVKAVQQKLGITADGIFGTQTQNAVKAYQQANGLVADGIIGTQTWAKLNGTPTTPPAGSTIATPNYDAQAKAMGAGGASYGEYQDYLKTATTLSKAESDKIKADLGIPETVEALFAKPSQTTVQLYNTAYSNAGLDEVKASIAKLNESVAKKRSDLTEAIGAIDENPFLTETSRIGRGRTALQQAEASINNDLQSIQSYQDLYTQGINEVNSLVSRQQQDFSNDQALNTAKLNYLLAQAESEIASTGADAFKTAQSSNTQFFNAKQPDLVGTSDTGYYQWNGMLGKYTQAIAPSAKSTSGDTFKPSTGDSSLVGRYLNTEEGKALYNGETLTPADLASVMSDPTLFYPLLQKANEAGIY